MASEFLQLGGRRIELRNEVWPITKVRLDSDNPRLRDELRQKGIEKPTDSDLDKLIFEQDDTKKLMRSIEATKGLIEAPWVMPDGRVKEGNRRTTSMRRLAIKDPETYGKMPVKVLPKDITDKEIRLLLAIPHVVGKKPWLTAAQARTLFEMNELDGLPYDEIAQTLGMSKTTVTRRINAYKRHERYLKVAGDTPENVKKFSFFEEVEKNSEVRKAMDPNEESYNDELELNFFRWIREGKLRDARQTRDLAEIVANDEAVEALEDKGYDAAMRVLAEYDPAVESKLYQMVDKMIAHIDAMPKHEMDELKLDPAKQARWRKLGRALAELQDTTGITLIELSEATTA